MATRELLGEEAIAGFLEALAGGATTAVAAKSVGLTGTKFRSLARNDEVFREQYQEALEARAAKNADMVDDRVQELVMVEEPAAPTVALWAKRWNHAYRDSATVTFEGPGGGPILIEGRAVVGLADVVRLAREVGVGHLIGLDAGDSGGELAAAADVLPDPS